MTRSRPSSVAVPDVTFSRRALASLRSTDDFLRPRSPGAADALIAEINSLCDLIAAFPEMGRVEPRSGLRFHITRKYRNRVVYRVIGGSE
jgi:plasmid stabilization system protein ParE